MNDNIKKIVLGYKYAIISLLDSKGDKFTYGRWNRRICNGFSPLESSLIAGYLNNERKLLIENYGYEIFSREFTIYDFMMDKND